MGTLFTWVFILFLILFSFTLIYVTLTDFSILEYTHTCVCVYLQQHKLFSFLRKIKKSKSTVIHFICGDFFVFVFFIRKDLFLYIFVSNLWTYKFIISLILCWISLCQFTSDFPAADFFVTELTAHWCWLMQMLSSWTTSKRTGTIACCCSFEVNILLLFHYICLNFSYVGG